MNSSENLKSNLIVLLIASFLALFVGEIALKKMGYKAGYKKNYTGFAEVDSLIVYQNYITDEYGSYVLSPLAIDSVIKYYNHRTDDIQNNYLVQTINLGVDNFNDVIRDFSLLKRKTSCEDDFSCYIKLLKDKKIELDDVDSAYLAYVKQPFNKNGFRSVAFKNYSSTKPKVLLIGDSFTWGMTAYPFYNSFADQLVAKGYVVYNTGISSTDPAQYLSIYRKYHSILKPDITIVNVFEGNDLMDFYRNPTQGEPHEHITNGGFYISNPEGEYLSAEEAYKFFVQSIKIPRTNIINKIASKTAITSLAWYVFYGKNRHTYGSDISEEEKAEISNHYLKKIDSIANSNNETLLFTLIPDVFSNYNKGRTTMMANPQITAPLFNGMEFHQSNSLVKSDFDLPDFHFNNAGMKAYTSFLDSLIIQSLQLN